MAQPQRSGYARGIAYALSAYGLWGLAPLYWPLMAPASALEILAHRMTWSLGFLLLLNSLRSTWPAIFAVMRNRRLMKLLGMAALLITVNWGLYIWSIVNGHVIDASLGYFINPLVNVALGVLVFREKLRRMQWTAVAIAAAGVVFIAVDAHALPWIGLTLGITFSVYGMLKKMADVDAVESLSIETILLIVPAASYLIFLWTQGTLAFGSNGISQGIFTLLAGVATAVPLLAFGAAAVRIPYSTMGIVQYISPSLQFIVGYLIYHEGMTVGRWVGFGIVWLALAIFSIDALRHASQTRKTDIAEFD